MRAVPGKNTSVERALRRALWAAGLRGYRLHNEQVPGTPDVVFGTGRLAVFVDGCFWHGCPNCYREPKSRKEYWTMKVQRNKDRDAGVNAACAAGGWRVVRLWEHEVLKTSKRAVAKVIRALGTGKAGRRSGRDGGRRRHATATR
jgi:DNA mismatch endonuclease (patch repair protein)